MGALAHMIPRKLEPEVMDEKANAAAYAQADFSAVNQRFVDDFLAAYPACRSGHVLDLGCGPADIPIRLAQTARQISVVAIDASAAMLDLGRESVTAAGLDSRVSLILTRLPDLPKLPPFDAIISNSLLHHLPDPGVLWDCVKTCGKPGAAVFIMDLFRPASEEKAREIVEANAADEDPILKEDFYNSLLAAFTPDEIHAQLAAAGLSGLKFSLPSDRHWLVTGRLS